MARKNKKKNAKAGKKVLTRKVWGEVSCEIFKTALLYSPPAVAIRLMSVSKRVKNFLEEYRYMMPLFPFLGSIVLNCSTNITIVLAHHSEVSPFDSREMKTYEKLFQLIPATNRLDNPNFHICQRPTIPSFKTAYYCAAVDLDEAFKITLKRVLDWYEFDYFNFGNVPPRYFKMLRDSLTLALPSDHDTCFNFSICYESSYIHNSFVNEHQVEELAKILKIDDAHFLEKHAEHFYFEDRPLVKEGVVFSAKFLEKPFIAKLDSLRLWIVDFKMTVEHLKLLKHCKFLELFPLHPTIRPKEFYEVVIHPWFLGEWADLVSFEVLLQTNGVTNPFVLLGDVVGSLTGNGPNFYNADRTKKMTIDVNPNDGVFKFENLNMTRKNKKKQKSAKPGKKVLTRKVWGEVSCEILKTALLYSPPAVAIRLMSVSKRVKKFLEEYRYMMPPIPPGNITVDFSTNFKVVLTHHTKLGTFGPTEVVMPDKLILVTPMANRRDKPNFQILQSPRPVPGFKTAYRCYAVDLEAAFKITLKRLLDWYECDYFAFLNVPPCYYKTLRDSLTFALPSDHGACFDFTVCYDFPYIHKNFINEHQVEELAGILKAKRIFMEDARPAKKTSVSSTKFLEKPFIAKLDSLRLGSVDFEMTAEHLKLLKNCKFLELLPLHPTIRPKEFYAEVVRPWFYGDWSDLVSFEVILQTNGVTDPFVLIRELVGRLPGDGPIFYNADRTKKMTIEVQPYWGLFIFKNLTMTRKNKKKKNMKRGKKVLTREIWGEVSCEIFKTALLYSPPAVAIRLMIVSKRVKKFLEENRDMMPLYPFLGDIVLNRANDFMVHMRHHTVVGPFGSTTKNKFIAIFPAANRPENAGFHFHQAPDPAPGFKTAYFCIAVDLEEAFKITLKRVLDWYECNCFMFNSVAPCNYKTLRDSLMFAIPSHLDMSFNFVIKYESPYLHNSFINEHQVGELAGILKAKGISIQDTRFVVEDDNVVRFSKIPTTEGVVLSTKFLENPFIAKLDSLQLFLVNFELTVEHLKLLKQCQFLALVAVHPTIRPQEFYEAVIHPWFLGEWEDLEKCKFDLQTNDVTDPFVLLRELTGGLPVDGTNLYNADRTKIMTIDVNFGSIVYFDVYSIDLPLD